MSTPSDRLRASVERLVGSLFPYRYHLVWRYVVQSATPGPPFSIVATPVSPMVPPQTIPLSLDSSGCLCVPSVGSTITVGFREGNGTLPYVVDLGPYSGASALPTAVYLGGAPGPLIARLGDAVTVPALTVTVPSGGGTVPVVVGGTGTTIAATITGSSKVVQSR